MFSEYDAAFGEFTKKIDKIRRYNGYKCFSGKNSGLENRKFDDLKVPGLWTDGFPWPFECDEVWLKDTIIIPEKIAGIQVSGSSAILTYMSACSSALYVNGEKSG